MGLPASGEDPPRQAGVAGAGLPPVTRVTGSGTVPNSAGGEAIATVHVSRVVWFGGSFHAGVLTIRDSSSGRTTHARVLQTRLADAPEGGVRLPAAGVDVSRSPWWTGRFDLVVTDGGPGGVDHLATRHGPRDLDLDADVIRGDLVIEREGIEQTGIPGTQVRMRFARDRGFYSAPFPSDDLQSEDGSIPLSGFPNPDHVLFVDKTLTEIREHADGFGVSSGVFFQTTGAIDPDQLPDVHESVSSGARVFLVGVDPLRPDYLRRYPVDASFTTDGGPFGAANLLSLLPLQGVPLLEGTRYAAVVLRDVVDAYGQPLGVSDSMLSLVNGERPEGLPEGSFREYLEALGALEESGVPRERVAALAVFTTGPPTRQLGVFREDVLSRPLPSLREPLRREEVFPEFCVYESTIPMPVYQKGRPPFFTGGGEWQTDEDGTPLLQTYELANFVLTLPRKPMPESGFPLVVFSRTGGGGERPLVDHGPKSRRGGSIEAGTGPALNLARAGFAGVSVDGPHGGRRNVTGLDEQLLMFNFLNPAAMRHNVRQSALELILLAHVMEQISVDPADCPDLFTTGGAAVRFDMERLGLMGHSMGATIAQPVLALEPRYGAAVLSGAGASWLENIVHKESPLDVKPLAEWILLYPLRSLELTEHDPALSLVQWAGEPSDAPAYNRLLSLRPAGVPAAHVLMLQGIVDTYILPPIANTTSLSMGLDLAGEPLDTGHPGLLRFRPLEELLHLAGGRRIPLPASGNKVDDGALRTAVVVQHPEDGIEDGHEIIFQTEAPKQQYECFLETFAEGVPEVCAVD
ncbi:MAG: hypothetical protein IT198_15990 [Acidimicrobiia bacterium]|nr:hypothetical protein [Acidimicrobiia bacterium]